MRQSATDKQLQKGVNSITMVTEDSDGKGEGDNAKEFWTHKYDELREFRRVHGHINPCYLTHGQLYSWLHRQKNLFRKGKLTAERQALLSELGVHFEYVWDDFYQQLLELKEKTASIHIDEKSDPKLHYWFWSQIASWKSGKLDRTRIKKLLDLGVGKDMLDLRPEKYETKRKKKRENLPNGVATIASIMNQDASIFDIELSPGVVSEMIQQGEILTTSPVSDGQRTKERKSDANWISMYKRLKAFREHGELPSVSIKVDKKLSLWIRTQRKTYREGKLVQWKFLKLCKIGLSFPDIGLDSTGTSSVQLPPINIEDDIH